MNHDKQLDLIREGKIPLTIGADGLPVLAHEPIYELMRFIAALSAGYMRLYHAEAIRTRCKAASNGGKEDAAAE